ncbi:MAG: Lrp/AsnC family transcriptional regulator [Candidatus Woesearchaeota archaeon]
MIKLDTKDKRILLELDRNSRQPISTIAKKVGLSKEVVNYRIKRLVEKGIIRGFHAVIDPAKIGYTIYRLFIKFQNITPADEEKITDYLRNHHTIGWVAAYEGFYDLAILFWAKDVYGFNEIYEEILNNYGKHFQEHFISIVLTIHHFKHNYLFDSSDYSKAIIGGKKEKADLDELDIEILKILAADGRKTTLEIGKKVGASPNTVKYRIKKLIDSGVIVTFNTMIDTSALGYQHYKVFLKLQNMNRQVKSRLMEYLRQNKNTIYITEAIGLADFEFEIQVTNSLELHNMLRDLRTNFPDIIRDCKPGLVFKEHMINYLPFPSDEKRLSK